MQNQRTAEEWKIISKFKNDNGIKFPQTSWPKQPNRDYCIRQAETIDRVIKANPEFPFLDHFAQVKSNWEQLAGPPPFNLGVFCRQHKIVNPAYDVAHSKEEALEQVTAIKTAMKTEVPPRVKSQLRNWLNVWQDRARVFDYDFGTAVVRKGASPQERARKEAVRQRSIEEYNNRMKRK